MINRKHFAKDNSIIVVDLGGTNIRFAVSKDGQVLQEQEYELEDIQNIGESVLNYQAFLKSKKQKVPQYIAIAAAGNVVNNSVSMTNAKMTVSEGYLESIFGFKEAVILNDFEALSYGLPFLEAENKKVIIDVMDYNSEVKNGDVLTAAGPGTGLGIGSVMNLNGEFVALPGEGGHAHMSAYTLRQSKIINALTNILGQRPTREDILSGPGTLHLYRAICDVRGVGAVQDITEKEVTERTLDGSCDICVETSKEFLAFLAGTLGDVALGLKSKEVFVAGGICPRMSDFIDIQELNMWEFFTEKDLNKGFNKDMIEKIPMTMILDSTKVTHQGLEYFMQKKFQSEKRPGCHCSRGNGCCLTHHRNT